MTEKIPTVNFQQECLLSQLKVDLSWKILDWDWGEKFHIAGYNKDRSDLRDKNKVHYVRQTTPFGQKQIGNLPYIAIRARIRDLSGDKS